MNVVYATTTTSKGIESSKQCNCSPLHHGQSYKGFCRRTVVMYYCSIAGAAAELASLQVYVQVSVRDVNPGAFFLLFRH